MFSNHSFGFNFSPAPAFVAGNQMFCRIRLYVLVTLIFFILACGGPSEGGSSGGTGGTAYQWTEVKGDNSEDVSFDGRSGHTVAVFDDGFGEAMWVIGGTGDNGDVWKSYDGKKWTEVTDDADFTGDGRYRHTTVVFDDKSRSGKALWIIAGSDNGFKNFNNVYKSTDGKKWIEVTDDAGFRPRYDHTTVVFDDKSGSGEAMWVIGGLNTTSGDSRTYEKFNDVWKSTDGKTWIEVTDDAGFSKRYSHTTVVFDDGSGKAMWVIGGLEDPNGKRLNDVWKSKNGKKWEQFPVAANFPARNAHTAVVFNDGSGEAMWVIAGVVDSGVRGNDVWKSYDGKIGTNSRTALKADRYPGGRVRFERLKTVRMYP
ncbi:hypothetical protein CHS0354_018496 [Potamilus streckersoni]|uniref:Exo-alpha-sialidase n=1 Tax=Potamilus streckersoni TaxID=2493646 RepID=A0AAE0W9Z7_9BIVA|nr:hypothetical protein CHS0354_018496 [Potamilus streckersoni]